MVKVVILTQNATFGCMIAYKNLLPVLLVFALFLSCRQNASKYTESIEDIEKTSVIGVTYAKSFSIENHDGFRVVHVNRPWPGATKSFKYLIVPKEKLAIMTFPKSAYDAIITTPIKSLVATSTTHIPALESLNALDKLVGFSDTKYISSIPARKLIAKGKIRELGNNESLNTEMVLELRPDVIVGFGIDDQNSPYKIFQKANIPVVYNGDWTEETPLGKAEWLKFFGVLLNKEKEADSLFREIETAYFNIKELASEAKTRPTVLSGATYKDVWYVPAGDSWAAQFISDAHANYLYQDTEGTGSLSLSLESVLEKAQYAEHWVTTSQFTSYKEMEQANNHYLGFKPFQDKNVYSIGATKGATGGLLYYELAPQRPDLVLKDLVHLFHPELLPDHTPYFFTPLH
ncbi:MAG: ABC transporter substrate-binding protein [Bacteroidota bacterium]